MRKRNQNLISTKKIVMAALFAMVCLSFCQMSTLAAPENTEVQGNVYSFEKDSHYDFGESDIFEQSCSDNTYGVFHVEGDISLDSDDSGIPSYEVKEGGISLFYNYGDSLLNASEDAWHVVDDKGKKVDDITLDSSIMKGAIIIQTSNDELNWNNVDIITNAFSEEPIRSNALYSSTDVEMINGCYYRVIVAYELQIRSKESNFLFINTDKYESKKYAEIYEFYAFSNNGDNEANDPNQTYSLGERVRVQDFDGYFGEKAIDKGDEHYGWELGNFFISGYTDEIQSSDGNVVFLKTVGDEVTLWFRLNQNINALNNNDKLSITADKEGYDQYFETPKMYFGRGVLIIRYTDHNNVKAEPIIYTNYLEANAVVGADTKVQLFEEGDYEVALDYEVTSDELIDKIGHYRIFFKFSVRNGNCMVYPFDIEDGSELTNSSMTENGFRLDLAKSRYLNVYVKREVLTDSADGLVEDTRFNGPAQDGEEYKDEGIYTITASNEYTDQTTQKKIYVGTNSILRAYMATGLSISEINDLVAQGATIAEDGTIKLSQIELAEETSETDENTTPSSKQDLIVDEDGESSKKVVIVIASVVIALVVIALGINLLVRKKRKQSKTSGDNTNTDGGDEL